MWAVDQVGGFIDSNGQPAKKGLPGSTPGIYYYMDGKYDYTDSGVCNASAASRKTTGRISYDWPWKGDISCIYAEGGYLPITKSSCSTGTDFNPNTKQCEAGYTRPSGESTPFTTSDWDKLQAALNNASGSNTAGDPNFVRDLIRASCEGSLAPQKCYDSLAANAPGSGSQHLSGPSSVTSPGTSSITVSKDKDGNATSTTTTSNTTFNITYGNNYYNYSSTTTKTKTNPDGSTETTTEEDPEETAEKYPQQPDPLSPVIKEYDKVSEAVKTPQQTVDGLTPKPWFSFGGSCQEIDFNSPIGRIKTSYCPTIESYVKPVLAFIFAISAYIYCLSIWRETTMTVRPT